MVRLMDGFPLFLKYRLDGTLARALIFFIMFNKLNAEYFNYVYRIEISIRPWHRVLFMCIVFLQKFPCSPKHKSRRRHCSLPKVFLNYYTGAGVSYNLSMLNCNPNPWALCTIPSSQPNTKSEVAAKYYNIIDLNF